MRPKIAVFGTPEISREFFEKINSAGEIVAVVTAPDRPAGRGKNLQKSPVKLFGEARDIPVFCPEKIDSAFAEKLKDLGAELFFVFAFGRIFSEQFLCSCPKIWNFHPSLLPHFRGPTPVPSAILAGEKISGFTFFALEKGVDSGKILAQEKISLDEKRADEIFTEMIEKGARLFCEIIRSPERFPLQEQSHEDASFCQKIQKSDGLLTPKKDTAEMALRKIRAFFRWPSAFLEDGTKFLRAKNSDKKIPIGEFFADQDSLFFGFSDATIEILELQIPGKNAISAEEFIRGRLLR